ncbi:MAG: hypothetical protein QG620_652 [Patescibacteria group bacterium]|nr:hypothetical protein [Patescibacteria group bacterium]
MSKKITPLSFPEFWIFLVAALVATVLVILFCIDPTRAADSVVYVSDNEDDDRKPIILVNAEKAVFLLFPEFGGCYIRSEDKVDMIYVPEEKIPAQFSEVGVREDLNNKPLYLDNYFVQEMLGASIEEKCNCSKAILTADDDNLAVLVYSDGSEECFHKEDIPHGLWSRLMLDGDQIVKVGKGPFAGQEQVFTLESMESRWQCSFFAASFYR